MLFNVVKHARTDEASVEVIRDDHYVAIIVKDEGKGFDPASLIGRRSRSSPSTGKRRTPSDGLTFSEAACEPLEAGTQDDTLLQHGRQLLSSSSASSCICR